MASCQRRTQERCGVSRLDIAGGESDACGRGMYGEIGSDVIASQLGEVSVTSRKNVLIEKCRICGESHGRILWEP